MKMTNLNHIEEDTREYIRKIIITHQEAFTLPDDPLPCANLTEHEIILKSGRVINLRSHKWPEEYREFSHEETQKLLQKVIIRHSQSEFNSPLWIEPKKGNKLRMVIDYRQINKDTDQGAYSLPMIDDILDQLGKAKVFSAFDLSADFHQIPIKEKSKKYTAVSTQQGHFEYNRMPFGLKIAPATFQRMMDRAFQGLIGQNCFVHVNDIVKFGKTIQEHDKNIEAVLKRICDIGLKLEPTKCKY